jgi:hypothetical protein
VCHDHFAAQVVLSITFGNTASQRQDRVNEKPRIAIAQCPSRPLSIIERCANANLEMLMQSDLPDDERTRLEAEYVRLQMEHRDLDAAIFALEQLGTFDQLQVQRLKKRKLVLRDRLTVLTDRLTPDIIA